MKAYLRSALTTLLIAFAALPAFAGEKVIYYHNDALGSPVAATNQQGQVIWRETYKPYGKRTTNDAASANNTVWFTGKQEESALGINYYGARWYNPEVGRFLTFDPSGASPDNIRSFNRYSYGNDNPYGYVDPDGRAPRESILTNGEAVVGGRSYGGGGGGGGLRGGSAGGGAGEATGGGWRGIWSQRGGANSAPTGDIVKDITLSRSVHGEAAEHAADAIKAGQPDVLTIDRAGAAANRAESLGGVEKVPGMHLDEYPPAMFKEGGSGASVRPISPRDNMSAGACIGNACRGLPDGARVRIKVEK